MWRIIPFLIIVSIYIGCDIINTSDTIALKTEFVIKDTTSVHSNTFYSGEPFDVYYRIINNTGIEYGYEHENPSTFFEIVKDDSVYVTSIDGCVFTAPWHRRILMPGDTLKGYWRGPQPHCIDDIFVLQPGEYYVRVLPGYHFKEFGVIESEKKQINIIPQ
jgi:hypothetical protein